MTTYDSQLVKQLLNTLLTYLDSMKNICDNIRDILERTQVTFNCVKIKSTPVITSDKINEYIKTMKDIPTLMDIIEKRGEK